MIAVVLDSNIYDKLEQDAETADRLRHAIKEGYVEVIMPREVAQELHKRPAGLPTILPVRHVGNTVGRVGLMRAGDSLGRGDVFYLHKGESNKMGDAFVADASSWHADWFVSEDKRSRSRFTQIVDPSRCLALDYSAFVARLGDVKL